jgi:hypothetical protein
MKRSFTGPVWLLLIFGLFETLMVWQVFQAMRDRYSTTIVLSLGQVGFIAIALMWPVILGVEALVYWMIRRRNRAQVLSWTHGVIFCFAFLLNGFIYLLEILHSPIVSVMYTRGGRIARVAVFWALVLLAHAAFVQVLILAYRKSEPVKNEGGGAENILDDVIL